MRVESDAPVKSGGWIHRLSEPLPEVEPPREVEKKRDWTNECRRMYRHRKAAGKREDVARQLGVSVKSLELLRVGVGWDEWNGAEYSSWPSRDHTGRCIGFVRRYQDGAKRTNPGGSTGVFYTANWFRHDGPILIVEGGSDVAACETHGLCAIGRASNVHGAGWIRKMLVRKASGKRVIVVGERDEKPEKRGQIESCPKDCQGCAWCWPGRFGMEKVAAELGAEPVMVLSPHKDIREMLSSGDTWLIRKLGEHGR